MSALTKWLFLRILPVFFAIGFQAFALSAHAASTSSAQEYPRKANEFFSAIVIDTVTKQTLYEYRADETHPAASLTKIPNAITAANLKPNWNKTVTLTAADEVGGGRLRVNTGTKITMRDLFFSSITASANNAATALARLSGLGYKPFIARMNKEAKKLGAAHSTFVDASGMSPNNLTTARDMAKLMQAALQIQLFQKAATSKEYPVLVTQPKTKTQTRVIHNTNILLTQPEHDDLWITGGKTGYLPEAQYNLAIQVSPYNFSVKEPERRKKLLIVVLGAPTKEGSFATAKRLAEWAWNSHEFTPTTSISRR